MLQLTNEEKESLSILSKKYNVKFRIYFFENEIKVFSENESVIYDKMTFATDSISFKLLLEKIESNIIDKK